MSQTSGRWDDLAVRLASSVVIALLGLGAIWIGGLVFLALSVVVSAVMVWELVRMLDRNAPAMLLAGLAGGVLAVGFVLPAGFALPLLLVPALAGFAALEYRRASYATFCLLIVVAGYGLYSLREQAGFTWLLWLVLVVIVTDIGGYFAGRFIGGPKFWPRVSPKKTWSGTAAGWIGAALVGAIFAAQTGTSYQLVGISVAISMASQLGDIGESALKRRVGVKDSSALLPGHGGVFDRFDGMLGASVFLLLVQALIDFPVGGL